jgi:hypothetical protein
MFPDRVLPDLVGELTTATNEANSRMEGCTSSS